MFLTKVLIAWFLHERISVLMNWDALKRRTSNLYKFWIEFGKRSMLSVNCKLFDFCFPIMWNILYIYIHFLFMTLSRIGLKLSWPTWNLIEVKSNAIVRNNSLRIQLRCQLYPGIYWFSWIAMLLNNNLIMLSLVKL